MYILNDNGKIGLFPKLTGLCKWAGETAEGEQRQALSMKVKAIKISYTEKSARHRKKVLQEVHQPQTHRDVAAHLEKGARHSLQSQKAFCRHQSR